MNNTAPIPDIISKYAEQARTIEQALEYHERGTQLESGFSPYAVFYYEMAAKTAQLGKALSQKKTTRLSEQAHIDLHVRLQVLADRVAKAFAKVAPSELQDALRKNNADLVCNILKHKDLLYKNLPNGEQPLSYAIRCGSYRVVERLFKEFPIDTSIRDHQKLTPIDHALLTKDKQMIALVLGAAIGKRDIPESALSSPVHSTDLQTIAAEIHTLRYVPIASLPPLCQAAYLGEIGPLTDLIVKGADIHAPSGSAGLTPLHYAALGGQTAVIEELLKMGAKTDSLAINGKSLLHLAAMNGHADAVKLLLTRPEIQVNAVDSQGKTALHYAMISENLDAARALIQKGGDPLIATMKTTPFAILLHLSKGRSEQRDPLKLDLSTILTSAAYGSALGLDAALGKVNPALAVPLANLSEAVDAAPALFTTPRDRSLSSLVASLGGMFFWVATGLYHVPAVKIGLFGWQAFNVCKAARRGLATAWKNRHIETVRPLLNAGLHVFNASSAIAGLYKAAVPNFEGPTNECPAVKEDICTGVKEDAFQDCIDKPELIKTCPQHARIILGLPKDPSKSQIKKAYRDLSRKFHPDKSGGTPEANTRFTKISGAHELLMSLS